MWKHLYAKHKLSALGKVGRERRRCNAEKRWYPEEKTWLDAQLGNQLYPGYVTDIDEVGISFSIGNGSSQRPALTYGNVVVHALWRHITKPPTNTVQLGPKVVLRTMGGINKEVYLDHNVVLFSGIHDVTYLSRNAKLYLWEPIPGCGWYKGILVPQSPYYEAEHNYAQECYARKARFF